MSTHDFDPDSPRRVADTRRRWVALGVLSAAAVLLHVAALGGLNWAWPATERAPLPNSSTANATANPRVQVRVVDAPAELRPVLAPAAPVAEPLAVSEPAVPAAPMRVKVAATRAKPTPPAPSTPAADVERTPDVEPPVTAPPLLLAVNTPALAAPSASPSDDETIPHYRTRLPPATTLRYEVQRGMLRGIGDLTWRPQGEQYELKLDVRVSGLALLTQVSSGGFDAAGIAPLRFTDQRLRRSATAANFQRAADKITYSGSGSEFALRPGAQDRLSWMLQLAAIVAGDPQLAKAGAKVVMYVTGSHGDAGVWVFRCVGPEAVPVRGGSVTAIKFVREPRDAYDTTVQVWLDPQQHDLPVRATQKSGPNDEGYDLRLLEVLPG